MVIPPPLQSAPEIMYLLPLLCPILLPFLHLPFRPPPRPSLTGDQIKTKLEPTKPQNQSQTGRFCGQRRRCYVQLSRTHGWRLKMMILKKVSTFSLFMVLLNRSAMLTTTTTMDRARDAFVFGAQGMFLFVF